MRKMAYKKVREAQIKTSKVVLSDTSSVSANCNEESASYNAQNITEDAND